MKTVSYDGNDVMAFAFSLLNSDDMNEMPAEAPPKVVESIRRMGEKHGLPARLVVAYAGAMQKGRCNCGTCLVLRLHPDAKAPTDPERGLLYAALTIIASLRGPQPGPVCDLHAPEEVQ
jgi:hypothetical protein